MESVSTNASISHSTSLPFHVARDSMSIERQEPHSHNSLLPASPNERPLSTWITPEQSSSQEEEESRSLSEIYAILRKRVSIIICTVALCSAVAFIYCIITPNVYKAQTTLEMRGYAPLLATSQSETLFGSDTRRIEYQKTTVAKLKLEGLADQVLTHDSIAQDLSEYWDSRLSPVGLALASVGDMVGHNEPDSLLAANDSFFLHKTSAIRRYLDLIDVTPVHETNLVTVSASTSRAELSQKIANAHARAFITHLQRERQEALNANLHLLQKQASELKSRVAIAEGSLAEYAAEHKLLTATDQSGSTINLKQIESLGTLLAETTGKRIKSEAIRNEALSKKAGEFSVSDNEVTRQLQITLNQAEGEYATLGSKVTPAFPAMLELRAKISSLRKAILEERKRSLREIESIYQSDREAERRLRDQIEAERSSAQQMSQKLIQYNVLSKEASSLRDLYQTVLKQAKEIEISSSVTPSNVFISDFASLPTSPSAPKRGLILVLFSLVGLGLGSLIALIVESLDTTIRSPHEAQKDLDLPLLGAVPRFPELLHATSKSHPPAAGPGELLALPPGKSDGKSQPSPQPPPGASSPVALLSDNSAVIESLKTIRAGILLSSADRPPRIMMISSAVAGEGKTTILSNIAGTLAQAHHKTIMIDGDLRNSGLSKAFSMPRTSAGVGLSDLLTGQAQLSQVISPTAVAGLDIIRTGSKAPNPAELLGSLTMRNVVEQLSKRYDFILIDSPPLLPVADGLVISRLVDSVVMVVRSRFTDRTLAQEAARRLERVHARILGVVLNDLDPRDDMFDVSAYGEYVTT
jgi:succinoglycan biosynthesis transport protein ExoP